LECLSSLLPSQGVRWQALDERSAQATLTDGALALTLTFVFGTDGLIESVRTEGGKVVMHPWEGRWSNVQAKDGMRAPMIGEVAWLLPEAQGGRKPYWRGTITDMRDEFALVGR
jgi:hypothetical protein